MSTPLEQTCLLDLVAHGEPGAIDALLQRYAGLVWTLVRRKIGVQSDAEDLVQEIFADIWKSASRFNPAAGSEDTFIAMIARRRVIDHIRKSTRTPKHIPYDGAPAQSAPAMTGDRSSEIKAVLEVLGSLRPERRQTLELSIIQGLSHAQISESTSMPLGTVKAHLRRGLEEVRQRLKEQIPAESKEVSR